MSEAVFIKPKEERKMLKKRLKPLKRALPENWILLFIHDNPVYKGQSKFLSNVIAGRSLHRPTIELIDKWNEGLKEKKVPVKGPDQLEAE